MRDELMGLLEAATVADAALQASEANSATAATVAAAAFAAMADAVGAVVPAATPEAFAGAPVPAAMVELSLRTWEKAARDIATALESGAREDLQEATEAFRAATEAFRNTLEGWGG